MTSVENLTELVNSLTTLFTGLNSGSAGAGSAGETPNP
ncbi:hypothetical protein SAMN05444583_102192 [Rhodococcus maanshanensis]|uniref:Uncharacterized protein n=1 Tax=Rhodococcus maanshanensis TaxID=183556 RepID=A0A1H7HQG0_9NOCA|nr:hypothetical protein SAMN05444583_102192 [Rhodococcus maanshanensis]